MNVSSGEKKIKLRLEIAVNLKYQNGEESQEALVMKSEVRQSITKASSRTPTYIFLYNFFCLFPFFLHFKFKTNIYFHSVSYSDLKFLKFSFVIITNNVDLWFCLEVKSFSFSTNGKGKNLMVTSSPQAWRYLKFD